MAGLKQGFMAICVATLFAALLFGCLQEKQAAANSNGNEPTPPPLPDDELTGGASAGTQATATLEANDATGAGGNGNDDSPPPLPA